MFLEEIGLSPAEAALLEDAVLIQNKWWELFGDPDLNALEQQIDVSNQTLQAAAAQYAEARALATYGHHASQPAPPPPAQRVGPPPAAPSRRVPAPVLRPACPVAH